MTQSQNSSNQHNALVIQLKELWKVQSTVNDPLASEAIQTYIDALEHVDREEFDIQKKVLTKTRQLTEELSAKLDALTEPHA